MLEQVEKRFLAPLEVVDNDDQRRRLFKKLAKGPGDVLCRDTIGRRTEQRVDCVLGIWVVREDIELSGDFDHRRVGDALPIGEAPPLDNARVKVGDHLGHEAGLADPGLAHDRQKLAAPLLHNSLPAADDYRDLLFAANEGSRVETRWGLAHCMESECLHRPSLAL
jgi:hypothetical protein